MKNGDYNGHLEVSRYIVLALAFVVTLTPIFPQQAKNQKTGDKTESLLLTAEDILDWPSLFSKLSKEGVKSSPSPSRRLWKLLNSETKDTIQNAVETKVLDSARQSRIVNSLNDILRHRDFFQDEDFLFVKAFEAKSLLGLHRMTLAEPEIHRLNRQLLEASFPTEIAKRNVPGKKTYEEIKEILTRNQWPVLGIPGITAIAISVNEKEIVFKVGVKSEDVIPLVPEAIEGVPVETFIFGAVIPIQGTGCTASPTAFETV